MRRTEWPPQKGDIVSLKPGFDHSFEGLAVRRAGLPLKENSLYEVVGYRNRTPCVVLILREVRSFHIAGVHYIFESGSESFPYTANRFQRVSSSEPWRSIV